MEIKLTPMATMKACSYLPFSVTKAPVMTEAKKPAPVANSCVNAMTDPAYLAAMSKTLTATPAMKGALPAYMTIKMTNANHGLPTFTNNKAIKQPMLKRNDIVPNASRFE